MDTSRVKHECEQLILRAALLADQEQWVAVAELFTRDGELVRPSNAGTSIKGREAILASMQGTSHAGRSCRVITNLSVTVISEVKARVFSLVTRYSGSADTGVGHAISVGQFEDELVLTDHGWAFSRRTGTMALEFQMSRLG